jgi:hypothetical protein
VAKDLDMDYGVLHRLYHGQTDARASSLDRLADYLGLKLQQVDKLKRKRRK